MRLKRSWHDHEHHPIAERSKATRVHCEDPLHERRFRRGIGKPFGFAIDQEFARRLLIIDGDRDDDGLRAFGSRPQNFEGADLAVVAALAPVVQEILVRVGAAGLPKLVGFAGSCPAPAP